MINDFIKIDINNTLNGCMNDRESKTIININNVDIILNENQSISEILIKCLEQCGFNINLTERVNDEVIFSYNTEIDGEKENSKYS